MVTSPNLCLDKYCHPMSKWKFWGNCALKWFKIKILAVSDFSLATTFGLYCFLVVEINRKFQYMLSC